MSRKPLRCVVDLNIHALSAPGVWLPSKEDCYVSVSLFGQYRNTPLCTSVFPIIVHEKFRFEKTFYAAKDISNVTECLDDEEVIIELLQLSEYTDGCVRLACFSQNAREFLFPYPSLAPIYTSSDREVLMTRTCAHPGISPKVEFASSTVIKESISLEFDALEDALEEERRCLRTCSRSPGRRRRSRKKRRSRKCSCCPEPQEQICCCCSREADEDQSNCCTCKEANQSACSCSRKENVSKNTRNQACCCSCCCDEEEKKEEEEPQVCCCCSCQEEEKNVRNVEESPICCCCRTTPRRRRKKKRRRANNRCRSCTFCRDYADDMKLLSCCCHRSPSASRRISALNLEERPPFVVSKPDRGLLGRQPWDNPDCHGMSRYRRTKRRISKSSAEHTFIARNQCCLCTASIRHLGRLFPGHTRLYHEKPTRHDCHCPGHKCGVCKVYKRYLNREYSPHRGVDCCCCCECKPDVEVEICKCACCEGSGKKSKTPSRRVSPKSSRSDLPPSRDQPSLRDLPSSRDPPSSRDSPSAKVVIEDTPRRNTPPAAVPLPPPRTPSPPSPPPPPPRSPSPPPQKTFQFASNIKTCCPCTQCECLLQYLQTKDPEAIAKYQIGSPGGVTGDDLTSRQYRIDDLQPGDTRFRMANSSSPRGMYNVAGSPGQTRPFTSAYYAWLADRVKEEGISASRRLAQMADEMNVPVTPPYYSTWRDWYRPYGYYNRYRYPYYDYLYGWRYWPLY